MAVSAATMRPLRLLWWSLPLLGLAELGGHVYFSRRAPSLAQWQQLRPAVEQLRGAGELVVVAPTWAEPLARHVLGDAAFPLEQLGRADVTPFARAIEIGLLGQHAPELQGWRPVVEEQHGKFLLRVLENPQPARLSYDFLRAFGPHGARVTSDGRPCAWTTTGRATAGGLHGPMASPTQRFQCGGGDAEYVGLTLLDDQDYRPRYCLWAHPPRQGQLVIEFPGATLGARLRGYGGLSWFLMRDGAGTPVELEVRVDGRSLGRWEHRDEQGWRGFEFATGVPPGTRATVEFRVSSADPAQRQFCFQADSR